MSITVPDLPDVEARVGRVREVVLPELRGAARTRRRSVTIVVRVAAAAAVMCAIAVGVMWPGSTPSNALAVKRGDGWLELRIADATASPQQLTEELHDAGVRGEVRIIPVPKEHVGTWVVIAERAGLDAHAPGKEVVRLSRIRFDRDVLRIPIEEVRESTGSFLFYVGRAARPGERYAFPFEKSSTRRFELPPSKP